MKQRIVNVMMAVLVYSVSFQNVKRASADGTDWTVTSKKYNKRMIAWALAVTMFMSSVIGCGDIRPAMAQNNENAAEITDSGNKSFQNYDAKLLTIDDQEISTKSNGEKATILVFGRTTCWNTRTTISDLAKSGLTEGDELRVIYADIGETAKEDVQEFASVYGNEYINFCYYSAGGIPINPLMWNYADAGGIDESVTLPVTVLIDENDQVQKVLTGVQRQQDLLAEINKFAELSYSGKTDPTETPDHSSEPDAVASEKPQEPVKSAPPVLGNDSEYTQATVGGMASNNLSFHNYLGNYARPVYSYLEETGDGYVRVEAGGDSVVVEQYSDTVPVCQSGKICVRAAVIWRMLSGRGL